jgi:hypothetical protein
MAMEPEWGKSDVINFTVGCFRALDYAHGRQMAHMRMDLPLHICGEDRHAKTDVCLVDHEQNNNILLIV